MNRLLFFMSLAVLLFSCKKEEEAEEQVPITKSASLLLKIRFQVDGPALEFDTIKYENEAHNHYSVHTLVFYLSQLSLVKEDNSLLQIKDWIFVDATDASTLQLTIDPIPPGCYKGFHFNIGIDSAHNVPDGLPATTNNLMMEWPVSMGGGYHFLKLEGYFADTNSTPGYAMHLGTNMALTTISLSDTLCFTDSEIQRTLTANINEWFRTPETYDFNVDGNYSMGNAAAMSKLAANGIDVFTIH